MPYIVTALKVPVLGVYWSAFSRIWTEYEDLQSKSPYSVQMRKNAKPEKLRIRTLLAKCIWVGKALFRANFGIFTHSKLITTNIKLNNLVLAESS